MTHGGNIVGNDTARSPSLFLQGAECRSEAWRLLPFPCRDSAAEFHAILAQSSDLSQVPTCKMQKSNIKWSNMDVM